MPALFDSVRAGWPVLLHRNACLLDFRQGVNMGLLGTASRHHVAEMKSHPDLALQDASFSTQTSKAGTL